MAHGWPQTTAATRPSRDFGVMVHGDGWQYRRAVIAPSARTSGNYYHAGWLSHLMTDNRGIFE
jgi:hypothetical protein